MLDCRAEYRSSKSLADLPLDILRDILQLLSARDVINAGATCRILHETKKDYHVWLPRIKQQRARIGTLNYYDSPTPSLTAEDLKERAIREYRISSNWRRKASIPLEQQVFLEAEEIFDSVLLPGGEYIILVYYSTAEICLKSLERGLRPQNGYELTTVATSHSEEFTFEDDEELELLSVESLHTLEHGLLLVLTVSKGQLIEIQFYHVDTATAMPSIRNIHTSTLPEATIMNSCAQGDTVATFYGHEGLRYIQISNLGDPGSVKTLLPELAPGVKGCDLCMPSPHTLIVFGLSYIRIYHVPDFDSGANANIRPIWGYTDWSHTSQFYASMNIWDPEAQEAPTVRLISKEVIHVLRFRFGEGGRSRLEVTEHDVFPAQWDLPVENRTLMLGLKCQRGIWWYVDREASSLNFTTVDLDNLSAAGSIQFVISQSRMGDSIFDSLDFDFDEISGRVLFTWSTLYGSVNPCRLHIADTI